MSGARWSQSLGGAGGLPGGAKSQDSGVFVRSKQRTTELPGWGWEGAAALGERRACESGSG